MFMKKKMRLIAASLFFCIMFIGCGEFFRYILIDDTTSYTRITFHEMYEQDDIDVLFVGSSHCYRSFVPEIFDEKLGVNTFNCGSSDQQIDGSYMIIKEVARYYNVKHIYLELYYAIALGVSRNERTNLTSAYIISDYLRPSWDKVQYLLNASTKDYYPNSFILARRNWSKFFDADYIKDLIIKKRTDAYKNYEYEYVTRDSEWYVGKGYVANNETIEDWNYFSARGGSNIDISKISEDWVHTLEDIITFCDERDISLTLVVAPVPDYMLASIENYDEYIEFIKNIIAGTNVNYYDFNLCKEQYFPSTSSLFQDDNHLNCYGAEEFSYLLADFINGEISEKELFYESYSEKLENLEPTVFGISYCNNKNDDGEQFRYCKIVSNENANLEYEIILSPEGGKTYKIQDFSDNRFFTIEPDEHGVLTIAYRVIDTPDEIWTTQISY